MELKEQKIKSEIEDYNEDIQFAENNTVDEDFDQSPSSEEKRELSIF